MDYFEYEGKTVEEATEKAIKDLGVSKEDLEIEVISNGTSSILSLVGIKKAKIKVRIKREKELGNSLSKAKEVLSQILKKAGIEAKVEARETEREIFLEIGGDNLPIIVGKHGQTLDALQFMVEKIVSKKMSIRKRIVVDAGGYRRKREDYLRKLALRVGEKVKKTGKAIILNPMNAKDRRIIHLTLAQDKKLSTKSLGEGALKKVMVTLKDREKN